MITEVGNESEISSNTVKIIIIIILLLLYKLCTQQIISNCQNYCLLLSGISVSKRYFVSLCFVKGQRDSVKSAIVHI